MGYFKISPPWDSNEVHRKNENFCLFIINVSLNVYFCQVMSGDQLGLQDMIIYGQNWVWSFCQAWIQKNTTITRHLRAI